MLLKRVVYNDLEHALGFDGVEYHEEYGAVDRPTEYLRGTLGWDMVLDGTMYRMESTWRADNDDVLVTKVFVVVDGNLVRIPPGGDEGVVSKLCKIRRNVLISTILDAGLTLVDAT